jgi:hypothetical protein
MVVLYDVQFIEQEPGPRGSPQEPQPPPDPDVTGHPPVAPTPNAENCLSNAVALQPGQAGTALPCTNSSKRWLHSRQTYSKMGMVLYS